MLKLEDLRLSLASVSSPRPEGAFGWLMPSARREKTIRGVYLWGAAGRGKTMLMAMHFHEYGRCACLHSRMAGRSNGAVKGDDPIAAAADSIARRTWVLCFDDFSVTDIADAMILGRLFSALLGRGVVIVATSNVRPDLLAMIEAKMEVVQLNARTDFRLEKLGGQTVYFVPADKSAAAALTGAFKSLTGGRRK